MSEGLQQYREAKQVLDIIFNSPFSSRQWPGYLSVEQIMERLGLHRRSVYKLIHTHLVPRGGGVPERLGSTRQSRSSLGDTGGVRGVRQGA